MYLSDKGIDPNNVKSTSIVQNDLLSSWETAGLQLPLAFADTCRYYAAAIVVLPSSNTTISADSRSASFSTSILYDEKTDTQEAVEPAEPGRVDHPDNFLDSDSDDRSRYPHAIHEIAKRDPLPKPHNRTFGQGKQSNGTKSEAALNQAASNSVNDWKSEKASIAASTIFVVVALAAIALLGWTIFKRIRARQRRRKGADDDSLDERKARREAMMFSRSHSAGSYMVEEEKDGKVIRVFYTSRNKLGTNTTHTPIAGGPLEQIKPALSMKAEATRHMEGLGKSKRGRHGSIPKEIVVVSSPLQSAVSRTAVPGTQKPGPAATNMSTKSSEHGFECPRTPAHSLASDVDQDRETELEVASVRSYRRSLLRLPSIKESISPFCKF
ncbi:hypothetical protein BDW66DRAFT_159376 [Aspergillus desertorum]